MNTQINIGEFASVVAGLMLVGSILKNAFPTFPNRLIPMCTWLLGILSYLTLSGGWADGKQWIAAVIAAATATGAHSGIKNSFQGAEAAGKITALLLLSFLFPLSGCKTRQLESGGAYAPAVTNTDGTVTATAAPDLTLFVLDSTYDLAYSGVLTVCKIERDNRAFLKTVDPDIKRLLDKVRAGVWDVDQKWALARQAYLSVPVADNLDTLRRIVAEMQRWNSAATALLPNTVRPPPTP